MDGHLPSSGRGLVRCLPSPTIPKEPMRFFWLLFPVVLHDDRSSLFCLLLSVLLLLIILFSLVACLPEQPPDAPSDGGPWGSNGPCSPRSRLRTLGLLRRAPLRRAEWDPMLGAIRVLALMWP